MSALSTRYRTALVTGVSSGLGHAFAEMLLREGVAVWGTARCLDRLGTLSALTGFTPLVLDLTQGDRLEPTFSTAAKQAGGSFDLVVNNAGYGVFGAFAATPFEVWRAQIDSVLTGTVQLSHLAVRSMIARNQGCLVNVSSVAVVYPLPFMSGYNVAKAGVSALCESLIFETRGSDVTVIDFRPGDYRTAFNQSMHSTSAAGSPASGQRFTRAWETLEANLAAGPDPSRAARDLRKALQRGKSGTVYSGSFFQVKLALLFSRLAPSSLRRAIAARYFGAA